MMKYDFITIGDSSLDIFVEPEGLKDRTDRRFVSGQSFSFELGEKIALKSALYDVGGSACNTAVSFSRQGFKTAIFTALGDETAADKIIQKLEEESVELSHLFSSKKIQTNFSIIFKIGDERTIFVFRGLNDYSLLLKKKKIKTDWAYLAPLGENEGDVLNWLLTLASEKNVKIAWNPGSIQIGKKAQSFRSFLKCLEVLFLNREEAIKFANFPVRPKVFEVMRVLQLLGPKIVVVTAGKEGAYGFDGENFFNISALNQHRVDATGAGDSFASAFVAELAKNKKIAKENYPTEVIERAFKAAIINSSSVVNQIGAQTGLLKSEEIEEKIEKSKINIDIKKSP